MNTIRITKQFTFETGHALYGYDGKCKNVHGHSYKLDVTVIGAPISDKNHVKYGMVIDFGDIKKIVKEKIVSVFDHATVFNKNTPHLEMMLLDFAQKIKESLPDNIQLFSLKLQETNTSFASWYASDN